MMQANATRERMGVTTSVVLLASIATIAVSRAPGYGVGFALVFAAAAAMRLFAGLDGRPFFPARGMQAVGCSVAAVCLAYLLRQASQQGQGVGQNTLWALMEVTSAFQALVLLWRQRAFSNFLVILFSSVHATGIAFAVPGDGGLYFVGAYVVGLAWTLVLFERKAALEGVTEDGDGAVVHIRAPGERVLPWRKAARTTALLLALGLPLGAVLYVAAPRSFSSGGRLLAMPPPEGMGVGSALDGSERDDQPRADAFRVARTGPGAGGAPLGSVAEIKKNLDPWFEVSLEGEDALPPLVILRENIKDLYHTRGLWDETLTDGARSRIYRDADDNKRNGWFPLEHDESGRTPITLNIKVLAGGHRRLYLQSNETAVQIRRGGKALWNYEIVETADESVQASMRMRKDDVVLQRYVPPTTDQTRLTGRRSDRSVAPQSSYLQIPPSVAEPLRRMANQVVGTESDPWRRALRLEAWLQSEAFTYTLRVPRLDPANPIVDFLERTRSGHCECYAYAITLMLRALGHPARYARGFWGGDVLEERKSVILRGSHYHAWSEIYLDGLGWIALNPTPPDRAAEDAGSNTSADGHVRDAGPDERKFELLRLDEEGWSAFWSAVAQQLDRWVLTPLSALFSGRTGFAGVFMALLALWALRRRREGERLRRMVVAQGKPLPKGAYGQALLLLARKGVRRPQAWTPREFARFVGKRLPRAKAPFAKLTRLYEVDRYGGMPVPSAHGRQLLLSLKEALRPAS